MQNKSYYDHRCPTITATNQYVLWLDIVCIGFHLYCNELTIATTMGRFGMKYRLFGELVGMSC